MKKNILWLIIGLVIGILATVAVEWFWCCKSGCKPASENMTEMAMMGSPTTISVDTAAAWFRRYMSHPDTVGVLIGYTLSLEQLSVINMLVKQDSSIGGFRIYPGVMEGPMAMTMVLGVSTTGSDVTSYIYATGASGVGPCPTVCDQDSPIVNPPK